MFDVLKSELEEAAFMLAGNADPKEIHSKLVNSILLVEQLKMGQENSSNKRSDLEEVNKVSRRLKIWAKPSRQNQYNAKILNAYIELHHSGISNITEDDLDRKLDCSSWFWPNFNQMKAIAEKNHGKVFEVRSGKVNIWPPVQDAVEDYEAQVFSCT